MVTRSLVLIAAVMFAATTSFLGDASPWAEVVGNAWMPYVAAPVAMGLVTPKRTPARAGLDGAAVSVLMITAFYIVVPFDDGYDVPISSVIYWGAVGILTGAVLAVAARALVARAAALPWRLLLGSGVILTLSHLATTVYVGYGVVEVNTSSGVVHVGASTWDVVVAGIILLVFSCGLIACGLAPWHSRSTPGTAPTERDLARSWASRSSADE